MEILTQRSYLHSLIRMGIICFYDIGVPEATSEFVLVDLEDLVEIWFYVNHIIFQS